jgi:hypothetical protein
MRYTEQSVNNREIFIYFHLLSLPLKDGTKNKKRNEIYKDKKKDEVPVYATKVSTRSSGIAPLILNLGAIWKLMVSFVLWAYSRKCLDYLLSVGK